MKSQCEQVAEYMLENKTTIRKAAFYFGLSKSTVHDMLSRQLQKANNPLYREICQLMSDNWKDRQHRGGVACQKVKKAKKEVAAGN